jgi:hypothetical protein
MSRRVSPEKEGKELLGIIDIKFWSEGSPHFHRATEVTR